MPQQKYRHSGSCERERARRTWQITGRHEAVVPCMLSSNKKHRVWVIFDEHNVVRAIGCDCDGRGGEGESIARLGGKTCASVKHDLLRALCGKTKVAEYDWQDSEERATPQALKEIRRTVATSARTVREARSDLADKSEDGNGAEVREAHRERSRQDWPVLPLLMRTEVMRQGAKHGFQLDVNYDAETGTINIVYAKSKWSSYHTLARRHADGSWQILNADDLGTRLHDEGSEHAPNGRGYYCRVCKEQHGRLFKIFATHANGETHKAAIRARFQGIIKRLVAMRHEEKPRVSPMSNEEAEGKQEVHRAAA